MVPSGVIFPYNGTHASIPSGWTRETTLDDKYPKAWGDSVAPNNTGGSNTHTHASSHSHTMASHSHTFTTDTRTGSSAWNCGMETGGNTADNVHYHVGTGTAGTPTGGSLATQSVTWSSVNSEPPYYKVIFIKPTGSLAFVTTNILAYFNGLSNPTNWKFCDGNAGAPDLRGKYLKGAGTGADAGAGSGGTSHDHTVDHTHTVNAHGHTGYTPSTTSGNWRGSTDFSSFPQAYHTHDVTLDNMTDTLTSYTGTAGSADTVEVAYKKMAIYTNAGGGMVRGIIGMWLGATSAIPVGWKLCDGNNGTVDLRDKFIKVGQDITENGNTGGSNTHVHSAKSHTHTSSASNHNHTGSTGYSNNNGVGDGSGGAHGIPPVAHTHTISSVSTSAVSYSTDNMTPDTVDHQPAYRTVAYIEYQFSAGGSFLLNLV